MNQSSSPTNKKATDFAASSPQAVRKMIREGQWTGPTAGMCAGHVQANLIALPRDWAFEFLLFAQRNPVPCPVLDVTDPGSTEPATIAPGADISKDIPRYRIWEKGVCIDEPEDASSCWRDDLVAFLLGCSFSFESAMMAAGCPVRHIEENRNVPMYVTNIACRPAGRLKGNMVVSMRPLPGKLVSRAVLSSGRFPAVHGAPVYIGDPEGIGIADIAKPDFGDPVTIEPGEIPLFWGCGVTPQAILMSSRPPFAITHAPGHMFIADLLDRDLAVFP